MAQKKDKSWGYIFGAIVILMIVGWVVYPKLITLIFPTAGMSPTEKGVFGDMFGSLNALFSGIALVGVIYAVLMQRKELQLQREELVLTREEMRRSAEAQEESSKSLSEQLKEMKDQTELQLRPFVVIKYDDLNYGVFIAANIGNSTAININIYNDTSKYYVNNDFFTLEKSETKIDLGIGASTDPEDNENYIITFQNMQSKDYYVKVNIRQKKCEVIELERAKYELPDT